MTGAAISFQITMYGAKTLCKQRGQLLISSAI